MVRGSSLELMDHTFDGHEDSISGDLRNGLGQVRRQFVNFVIACVDVLSLNFLNLKEIWMMSPHNLVIPFFFVFYIPKSEMWSNEYPIVIISYKYLNDIL